MSENQFNIKTSVATKNHLVTVSAYYDGKAPPIARARLTGFGDMMDRDKSFDEKSLNDALTALQHE